jgi:hypothetical protein
MLSFAGALGMLRSAQGFSSPSMTKTTHLHAQPKRERADEVAGLSLLDGSEVQVKARRRQGGDAVIDILSSSRESVSLALCAVEG